MAGKPSVAAEVLRRMRLAGVEPNVIAYTSLLSRCGWGVDAAARHALQGQAAVACRDMARAAVCYRCLSLRLTPGGACPALAQLAQQHTAAAHLCPPCSYSATGDLEGAKRVLQDMAAAGCEPNVKTYTELMSQLAAKGGCPGG